MSNEELAVALGMSRSTVYRWAKGAPIPGVAQKLIEAYENGAPKLGRCMMDHEGFERIRVQHGMSRVKLAQYLGTSVETVDNWRFGRRGIHPCAVRLMYLLDN